jgi:hypothetical protein
MENDLQSKKQFFGKVPCFSFRTAALALEEIFFG